MKTLVALALVLLCGCSGTLREKSTVCLGFCSHTEVETETHTKEIKK
jgi:outer membrane biogenesis lipoprotein LolB